MNCCRRNSIDVLCIFFALLAPLLLFTSAFAAPAKLVIAYAAVTARIMPLLIAQDQGFFAKYGIDSQPVLVRGATPLVTGLAAGDIQIGRTAGAGVLSAVGGGHDFKMVATFTARNSYNVVVKPTIKRPEDIRGKRIAINSYGGGTWVGAMLWLEHFGLDAQRDNILLQSFGDQTIQAQALDAGAVDVVFVDTFYANWLKAKGMTVLADYTELKQPLVSQSTGCPAGLPAAARGSRRELPQVGNRSDGVRLRREKQDRHDEAFHAPAPPRRGGRRGGLRRPSPRRRAQAAAFARRHAQPAKTPQNEQPEDRRAESRRHR
jgi:ABC-type nitrate/sulfonate/bicarbonate transport system substrate-binding protein